MYRRSDHFSEPFVVRKARAAWYDRRRHGLPEKLLDQVLSKVKEPSKPVESSEGGGRLGMSGFDEWEWHLRSSAQSFLLEYTQSLRQRWAHTIANAMQRKRSETKTLLYKRFGPYMPIGVKTSDNEEYRLKCTRLRAFSRMYGVSCIAVHDAAQRGGNFIKNVKRILAEKASEFLETSVDLLVNEESKLPQTQLLFRVQQGDEEAVTQLLTQYERFIRGWAGRNKRKMPYLQYSEIHAIGMTGFWHAARNAVTVGGFLRYAQKYMDGELIRVADAEAPVPGMRFGLETLLEERIGDITASRTFFGKSTRNHLDKLTREANRRLGSVHITEEALHTPDLRQLYSTSNLVERLFRQQGVRIIRERMEFKGDRLLTPHLIYNAIDAQLPIPQVKLYDCEGKALPEERRVANAQKVMPQRARDIESVLCRLQELAPRQRAAVLLFNHFRRRKHGEHRVPRFNELRQVAEMLHIKIPPYRESAPVLKKDPWVDKQIYFSKRRERLERLCGTMFENLTRSSHSLWGPGAALSALEEKYPGVRRALIAREWYVAGHANLISWLDGGRSFFCLRLLSEGVPTRKTLVLPEKPDDNYLESISLLQRLTRTRKTIFPKVYDIGGLQTPQQTVPYAIVDDISGESPRWATYDEEFSGCRMVVSEDAAKNYLLKIYALLREGVVPPLPTQENTFVVGKEKWLFMGDYFTWRMMQQGESKLQLAKERRRALERTLGIRFKYSSPFEECELKGSLPISERYDQFDLEEDLPF